MDLGSIFMIIALVVLVALYVAQPLLQRQSTMVSAVEQKRSALMAERDRILDALQELDFDQQLGKIPAEDYPGQRELLLTQGTEVLKALDALQVNGNGRHKDDLDKMIEKRRTAQAAAPAGAAAARLSTATYDDDLENLIAARRREHHKEQTAGFCPQCGHSVQKSDKFCSKCGASI